MQPRNESDVHVNRANRNHKWRSNQHRKPTQLTSKGEAYNKQLTENIYKHRVCKERITIRALMKCISTTNIQRNTTRTEHNKSVYFRWS